VSDGKSAPTLGATDRHLIVDPHTMRLRNLSARLWAGLSGSVLVGAAMLVGSWLLSDREGWAWVSDALLNVGSAILLLGLLSI
jgi:hypothetical protein